MEPALTAPSRTAGLDRAAIAGRGTAIVCCGDSGTGKTTWCRELVAVARARGSSLAGVVTWVDRDSAGARRWVEDLAAGERRLLGREDPHAVCGPEGGRWMLSDETLAWGDRALREAGPVDVLVVDELGPVELLHGRGWWRGAQVALRGPARLAVVTVRPLLLPRVLESLAVRSCSVMQFDASSAAPRPADVLGPATSVAAGPVGAA